MAEKQHEIDELAARTYQSMGYSAAQGRDVQSLRNWREGNGCMARKETTYLAHQKELVSLVPAGDNAVTQLEAWVEDK